MLQLTQALKAEPFHDSALARFLLRRAIANPALQNLEKNTVNFLIYQAQGKLNEAEPLVRCALEGFERTFGPDHKNTLTSVSMLGSLLQAQGKLNEAEPLLRRAFFFFKQDVPSYNWIIFSKG